MMKVMKKLMGKISIDKRPLAREQNEIQIRNPNFRRPQGPPPPQILQRGQRNQNDQVGPPFQENIIEEKYPESPEDHIH